MSRAIEARGLTVRFGSRGRVRAKLGRPAATFTAVDSVDLRVEARSSVGLVGESGCGKTTLARALVGLQPPTLGQVLLDGRPFEPRSSPSQRRAVQMVFQDPGSSLNPGRSVRSVLAELLGAHGLRRGAGVDKRCEELMALVGLPAETLDAKPRALSGGQRQRVGIARALAVEPEVLVADEAVAALDVSVQASIIELLGDLRRRLGLTLLFISHDLAVVRNLCQQVAVMYRGRVVEFGSVEQVLAEPRHPYTETLLRSVPRLGPTRH